jgi:hypothetical protein
MTRFEAMKAPHSEERIVVGTFDGAHADSFAGHGTPSHSVISSEVSRVIGPPTSRVQASSAENRRRSKKRWNRFALSERIANMRNRNILTAMGAVLLTGCVAEIPSEDGKVGELSQAIGDFGFTCRASDSKDMQSDVETLTNRCPVRRSPVTFALTALRPVAPARYRWRLTLRQVTYDLSSAVSLLSLAFAEDIGTSGCSSTERCIITLGDSKCQNIDDLILKVEAIPLTADGADLASSSIELQVDLPDCPETTAGGGGGGGGEECDGEITAGQGVCNPPPSPIIFDLGDRGYDLTSVDAGVQFDIDADGALEQVAWTARGSDDAFLALDRNSNGQIDDGNELFGNFTKLANGKTSAHGYIPLAEIDLDANGGNGNGYVDSADRDFATLRLWTDRDHNGRASSAELIRLGARGIYAISLDADESDVVDEHGNHLAYVSPAYAMRGFRIERIRTTDVFFRSRELAR